MNQEWCTEQHRLQQGGLTNNPKSWRKGRGERSAAASEGIPGQTILGKDDLLHTKLLS